MQVGDLVISNMWFAQRKVWNEKRIGLVIGIVEIPLGPGRSRKSYEIMWQDTAGCSRWDGGLLNHDADGVWTKAAFLTEAIENVL